MKNDMIRYRNEVHLLSIVGGGLDDGRPS